MLNLNAALIKFSAVIFNRNLFLSFHSKLENLLAHSSYQVHCAQQPLLPAFRFHSG